VYTHARTRARAHTHIHAHKQTPTNTVTRPMRVFASVSAHPPPSPPPPRRVSLFVSSYQNVAAAGDDFICSPSVPPGRNSRKSSWQYYMTALKQHDTDFSCFRNLWVWKRCILPPKSARYVFTCIFPSQRAIFLPSCLTACICQDHVSSI
jgi:hypothetical protein